MRTRSLAVVVAAAGIIGARSIAGGQVGLSDPPPDLLRALGSVADHVRLGVLTIVCRTPGNTLSPAALAVFNNAIRRAVILSIPAADDAARERFMAVGAGVRMTAQMTAELEIDRYGQFACDRHQQEGGPRLFNAWMVEQARLDLGEGWPPAASK